LVDPERLTVGDRVDVEIRGGKPIVHGRDGGTTDTGGASAYAEFYMTNVLSVASGTTTQVGAMTLAYQFGDSVNLSSDGRSVLLTQPGVWAVNFATRWQVIPTARAFSGIYKTDTSTANGLGRTVSTGEQNVSLTAVVNVADTDVPLSILPVVFQSQGSAQNLEAAGLTRLRCTLLVAGTAPSAPSPTPWTTVTPGSGWAAYNTYGGGVEYDLPQYRLMNSMVEISSGWIGYTGASSSVTAGSAYAICAALPAGYRPARAVRVPLTSEIGGVWTPGDLRITASGSFNWIPRAGATLSAASNTWIAIPPLRYPAA
jgi:hypothetical protein